MMFKILCHNLFSHSQTKYTTNDPFNNLNVFSNKFVINLCVIKWQLCLLKSFRPSFPIFYVLELLEEYFPPMTVSLNQAQKQSLSDKYLSCLLCIATNNLRGGREYIFFCKENYLSKDNASSRSRYWTSNNVYKIEITIPF